MHKYEFEFLDGGSQDQLGLGKGVFACINSLVYSIFSYIKVFIANIQTVTVQLNVQFN